MRKDLVFFFLLAALAGCTSQKSLRTVVRSASFEEVSQSVTANHDRIHTLKGEGRISIETPEMAQTASFTLLIRKPDSLLISLRGPFGIKVGTALITKKDFFFYNSLQNTLTTGTTNEENILRIFHMSLNFDDILNLFSGGVFSAADLHHPDEQRIENDLLLFVYFSGEEKRYYWIDPSTLLIRKIQEIDRNGTVAFEQNFRDFEETGNTVVPRSIQIIQPVKRHRISLSYSDVELNNTAIECTLTVPENAERIHR
jgi:outer membrane lipoprotein-sorting protein